MNNNNNFLTSAVASGVSVGSSVAPVSRTPSILKYPVYELLDGSYILYLQDCITVVGALVGIISLYVGLKNRKARQKVSC